jgi:hypothetical protein
MDFGKAFAEIHWPATITATIVAFVIGGLWYSPLLFATSWMAENHLSKSDLDSRSMAAVFGASFVLLLVAAIVLAMFIGKTATTVSGTLAGLFVGIGWVATSLGVLYLFESRSLRLWSINGGYIAVTFAVMGAILGAWH